jgi:hypothetical protein
MHYHCEIIIPPTDKVEDAVAEIMAPFDENIEPDENGYRSSNLFWDWYVIGGRFSGAHLQAGLDPDQLDAFFRELRQREVTVSSVQAGKQSLSPPSQEPEVDQLWRDFFPDHELKQCPFFSHFNNQYCDSCIDADLYSDISDQLTAAHLIVGGRDHDGNKWIARDMLVAEVWNGCTWQETAWNGNVKEGVDILHKKLEWCIPEWRKENTVRDNWIVVTVDYHA